MTLADNPHHGKVVADNQAVQPRRIPRPRQVFHARKRRLRSRFNAADAKTPHPSRVIRQHLLTRKWSMKKLARAFPRQEGENSVITQWQIAIYLEESDRERDLLLGKLTCAKLDQAFGLPKDTFFNLEKNWCEANGRQIV